MAFKVKVEDRIPAFPGRVVMTPVSGSENTFDMVRADLPLVEGTPINKTLFDSKTDRLVEDVTVYVTSSGSDIDGDGNSDAPFATIQKAIDALPKDLNTHTATISIGFGVYAERVEVKGFHSGRLIVGKPGEVFTINGIEVVNSSFVETNIYQIDKSSAFNKPLFTVKDGSNVSVYSNIILNGVDTSVNGMAVDNNSRVVTTSTVTITVNNCAGAIVAQWCSFVSLNTITGSGSIFGMSASQGSIVSYKKDTLSKMWSNLADSGGLVLTGNNSSDLSGATLDL